MRRHRDTTEITAMISMMTCKSKNAGPFLVRIFFRISGEMKLTFVYFFMLLLFPSFFSWKKLFPSRSCRQITKKKKKKKFYIIALDRPQHVATSKYAYGRTYSTQIYLVGTCKYHTYETFASLGQHSVNVC